MLNIGHEMNVESTLDRIRVQNESMHKTTSMAVLIKVTLSGLWHI